MKKTLLFVSGTLAFFILFCSCRQQSGHADTMVSKKNNAQQIAANTITKGSIANSSRSSSILATSVSTNHTSQLNNKPGQKQVNIPDGSIISTIQAKVGEPGKEEDEDEMYDGAQAREEFEFNRIKDPATGKVPIEKLLIAKQKAQESKAHFINSGSRTTALTWSERGPIFDSVGPSNGNGRGGPGGTTFPNTYTSGRIRAVMVDASDATGNTVFIGGVDGGLWKCTNFITGAAPNWTVVGNNQFTNLAISWIAQDPVSQNTMYLTTGEPAANADAVTGNGIWKSTDHGVNWSLLPSTTSYTLTFKILVDNNHNLYIARRGSGLMRSTDGGTTWTDITPSSFSLRSCSDIELSSTGKLHASFGYNTSANVGTNYRYTSTPATVTPATWSAPVSGLPDTLGFNRIQLATAGDIIYAAPTNNANNVVRTYKSVDGGATWNVNNAADYPTATVNITNTQGWYDITLEISPLTSAQFLVGGLDEYLSADSGKTVTKITNWVSTPPYVHADHHLTKWMLVGAESRIIIACDGGIFLSRDGGATFADRNQNLGIKQFYSVAIHPTTTNYFLAGAQDNGVHQLTKPGLASSVEVIGGDGAFTAIDQDQPLNQFGAYVYNQYRVSSDGGNSWSGVNFSGSAGMFINPWDYDNNTNILYGAYTSNSILRWPNPATSTGASTLSMSSLGGIGSTFKVSPYTANLLFIGGASGAVLKVTNANATPTVTSIRDAGMPAGNVSCINTGTNDQNLIMCFSNYGVTNVWVSTNGGTSWTGIDGNLPDMPVRWVMFYPNDNTKAIIATESGVWETSLINGASTVWAADPTFPNVRTDMLKYRSSDGTIAAATHGRGLWTTLIPIPTTTWTGNTNSSWTVASNWDNGVPDGGTNAIIPNVSPKPLPVMSTTQGVYNLTVNSSASITMNAGGNLQIGAVLINNGTITGSGTATLLSGGLGPITGTGTISNFTLTSGASISSGSSQSITGVLSVAGTLTTNSGLTLKSNSSGTASIAPITNGSISGSVTVERYFSNRRSWRLLSVPFSSSTQTIKAAWQEGATVSTQNPNAPYGTHITTYIGDPNTPNFDAGFAQSSIRTYSADAFSSDIAHTPNTTNTIVTNPAYFLFVRGDRSQDITVRTTTSSAATLRITGTVNTGIISPGVVGTNFSLIPNPYPSPVNFDSLKAIPANSGITTFYVWDATIAPFGNYRTVQITGSGPAYTYTATPGTADNNWRFIESGTAFMIPGSTTMSFTENTKASGTPPSSMLRTATPANNETQLAVNLYTVNADNSLSLSDGIREVFGNTYAATLDNEDAKKIEGFNLNLGIASNNAVLSVEKRPLPASNDMVSLKLWNTTPGNYQFELEPANFTSATQFIYLRDNYLNTYTPVSKTDNTTVNFIITADAASSGENRFSILFTDIAVAPGKPLLVVYPNPVQNGYIKLLMNNMPKGMYGIRLLNSLGQTIVRKQINHAEGTSVETVQVNTVKGAYMLEVTKPDNSKFTNKVIIN